MNEIKHRSPIRVPAFALLWLLAFLVTFPGALVRGASYYVSPTGSDSNDGLSEQTPWQTLKKVNASKFSPGDQILFQRGGVWRGTHHASAGWSGMLIPASGEPGKPITYSAYGEGEKPALYGSISASEEADWVETSPNVWGTRPVTFAYGERLPMSFSDWYLHCEGGAQSHLSAQRQEDGTQILTLKTARNGQGSHQIQLWGKGVTPENLKPVFALRFRARATVPFTMDPITVFQASFPYHTKCQPQSPGLDVTETWREYELILRTSERDEGSDFRWHLTLGRMPANCELQMQPEGVFAVTPDDQFDLGTDVGNLIFDHGNFTRYHRCGIKKWSLDALKAPGDYFYDSKAHRVFLFWPENPAKTCQSIELAMKMHVINQSGSHDVTFDGLTLCYGAAHGFGGSNVKRNVIRNCDICYVGGAHQFTNENGHPVRFGNGIEFWGTCSDCLIEKNRLWEIYDAALTNQGRGSDREPSNQIGMTYRENEIWNSEYSFEYWNSGGKTERILFEKNVCRDAGCGWAHGQRPDPNGAHLMFYRNPAETSNFVIRENVFAYSTEVCLRMESDWRAGLKLERNSYSQSLGKNVIRFAGNRFFDVPGFKNYQTELGMDAGSVCR